MVILLSLCSGYTGLCTARYARLHAVFMMFDYAKGCILIGNFTLFILLALCASYLCDECFRFRFVLALQHFLICFSIKGTLSHPIAPHVDFPGNPELHDQVPEGECAYELLVGS